MGEPRKKEVVTHSEIEEPTSGKKEEKKKLLGETPKNEVMSRSESEGPPPPILFYILSINVSCLHESMTEIHCTTLRCMKRDYCYRKKNISELILDSSISLKSSHPDGQ